MNSASDPEEVDDSRRRTGGGSANPGSAKDRKRTTLEELFKPPLDIMFKGGWQSARDAATEQNKWLLVNIQDAREFQCQVLNRDVWSSESVKSIVKEHFVFWQQYRENDEAQRFLMFYPVSDWPNIAVLDPRTGERLVTWSLVDSATFCDLVSDFLATNPPLDGGGGGRSSLSSSSAASAEQPPSKRAKTDDEPSQVSLEGQVFPPISFRAPEGPDCTFRYLSAAGQPHRRQRGRPAGGRHQGLSGRIAIPTQRQEWILPRIRL